MALISVIINFCSNEAMFLDSILHETAKFSDDIVVSYGSMLYNGEAENTTLIQHYKSMYPNVTFVCYEVDLSLPASAKRGVIHRPTAYWHNLARWTAVKALKNEDSWVFVIDADEIPDGDKVSEWIRCKCGELRKSHCYKLGTYWYFKTPEYQSQSYEDSILLIHKSHLTEENIFGDLERDYTISHSGLKLERMILGLDGLPMWHHFSFVRSRDGIKKKLLSWGHADDLFKNVNIDDVMNYMYMNDKPNDFVHGYQYNIVENKYNIQLY